MAIGVYCTLVAGSDLDRGVCLAVNHDGDSDSTESITGNLLGALLGFEAILEAWLRQLELRDVVETVGSDLLVGFKEGKEWTQKYPGQ